MNNIKPVGALALTLLLVACGEKQSSMPANEMAVGSEASGTQTAVYSGSGSVQSLTGNEIAIAHGPISGIGWPAMTMTFTMPEGMAKGVEVGSRVDFSFRQDGSSYVLTSLQLP